ncbi:hypothetical protein ADUPG1_006168 [Aduncisulcus paluster]|uniref:Nicastrin n=1 Tax=Aduncisulcus paluster TaxID=2918883 RepID=A0ABQ5KH48_9EUKA|nr:hypothetical protein ADUPG1_006168 [Aduncisulcus paluster]
MKSQLFQYIQEIHNACQDQHLDYVVIADGLLKVYQGGGASLYHFDEEQKLHSTPIPDSIIENISAPPAILVSICNSSSYKEQDSFDSENEMLHEKPGPTIPRNNLLSLSLYTIFLLSIIEIYAITICNSIASSNDLFPAIVQAGVINVVFEYVSKKMMSPKENTYRKMDIPEEYLFLDSFPPQTALFFLTIASMLPDSSVAIEDLLSSSPKNFDDFIINIALSCSRDIVHYCEGESYKSCLFDNVGLSLIQRGQFHLSKSTAGKAGNKSSTGHPNFPITDDIITSADPFASSFRSMKYQYDSTLIQTVFEAMTYNDSATELDILRVGGPSRCEDFTSSCESPISSLFSPYVTSSKDSGSHLFHIIIHAACTLQDHIDSYLPSPCLDISPLLFSLTPHLNNSLSMLVFMASSLPFTKSSTQMYLSHFKSKDQDIPCKEMYLLPHKQQQYQDIRRNKKEGQKQKQNQEQNQEQKEEGEMEEEEEEKEEEEEEEGEGEKRSLEYLQFLMFFNPKPIY